MMIINRMDIPGDIHRVESALDRAIPLVLFFVIPYFLYFMYMAIVWIYLFLFKPKLFVPFGWAMLITGVLTAVINITYQTAAPRAFVPDMGVLADLLKWHYSINRPLTSLPSLHVIDSLVSSFFISRALPKYKFLWWGIGIGISISTLFVKEHYVADVVVGAVIALTISIACHRYFERKSQPSSVAAQPKE
jgi:membrane-associated phospholipid phosphatase